MTFTITKEWAKAALERAIKTAAQSALGMITVGAALQDIQILQVLSVAVVAGIYSILTSIVMGVPEADYSGTLVVDYSGNLGLEVENDEAFQKLTNGKKQAVFKVDSPATNPPEVAVDAG